MKAVIIAGGKGKRLLPLTLKIPKPMIKIGPLPILAYQINLLKRYGIKEIIVLTAHLASVIDKYLCDNKNFGVNIFCLKSDESLGNSARVKLLENKLSDNFIVFYGDVMLDMDLKKLINFLINYN